MTFKEQQQIELKNKEIFQNIIATVNPEDFINFYINHTQKETLAAYGITNIRMLTKILKVFNYDFSKHKPSKFKGKAATRSHDSYVAAGKKSAETQQQHWAEKSDEEKAAWSEKQKLAHSSEHFRTRIKEINIEYQANLSQEEKERLAEVKRASNKKTWATHYDEILAKTQQTSLAKYGETNYTKTNLYREKIYTPENLAQRATLTYATKSKNNSFNVSAPEDSYYIYLINKYGEDDVIRQYKDDSVYPHCCDFYIKSLKLFIELNLNWTHGQHPFDRTNEADLKKLALWQEKAKTSKFYQAAIATWTVYDVQKFKDAKEHNLNYKVYYNEDELYKE